MINQIIKKGSVEESVASEVKFALTKSCWTVIHNEKRGTIKNPLKISEKSLLDKNLKMDCFFMR